MTLEFAMNSNQAARLLKALLKPQTNEGLHLALEDRTNLAGLNEALETYGVKLANLEKLKSQHRITEFEVPSPEFIEDIRFAVLKEWERQRVNPPMFGICSVAAMAAFAAGGAPPTGP